MIHVSNKKSLWFTYIQSYEIKRIQGELNRLYSLKTIPVPLQFYRSDLNYSRWQFGTVVTNMDYAYKNVIMCSLRCFLITNMDYAYKNTIMCFLRYFLLQDSQVPCLTEVENANQNNLKSPFQKYM